MQPLELAKNELGKPGTTCAVVRSGQVFRSEERGIRPIVDWLSRDEDFFNGAYVADKIIGKAAALLLVYGNVSGVFADVMSDAAASVLAGHEVPFSCRKQVPFIRNRENTGMCPMESRAVHCSSPREAYLLFRELLQKRQ